ncbi:MAG TPA: (2Fe-2S)-binding protein [Trebonia sp.]|jgi:aerobic-type carbon monoxide dehydrogenase small subunit (CoxS/CutS family)|nr:(2Fe-2S)-binding protein [Trebonia sp.]
MSTLVKARIEVNGTVREVEIEPRTLLADVLREKCSSKGTHIGCEHGVCGACTVLLDGEPVRSCLTLAVQADGRSVETVESLAEPDGSLNELQSAFHRHHGLQCGYCTPGILMSLTALFRTAGSPSEGEIRDFLQGHICRCTGYQQMIEAALEVSEHAESEHAEAEPAGTEHAGTGQ